MVKGSFFGYHNDNTEDTSTVNIKFCEVYPDTMSNWLKLPYISGLMQNNCSDYILVTQKAGSLRQFAFTTFDSPFKINRDCESPWGRMEVRGDSIFIDYRLYDNVEPEKRYYFTGKRIQ